MVCSICGTSGHNKATCSKNDVKAEKKTNAIIDTVPTIEKEIMVEILSVDPALYNQPTQNRVTQVILPEDVCEKMSTIEELCKNVGHTLGKGYVEGVYQQAIGIELQERNIKYVMEEPMPIKYKGILLGLHTQRLDIILHTYLPIVIELKAKTGGLTHSEIWQLTRYMAFKDYSYGVLINYNQSQNSDIQIIFIVKYEGGLYVYNNSTKTGEKMNDFSYKEK
jgi:GxxExxY protein